MHRHNVKECTRCIQFDPSSHRKQEATYYNALFCRFLLLLISLLKVQLIIQSIDELVQTIYLVPYYYIMKSDYIYQLFE
jgi:hypothetical protein